MNRVRLTATRNIRLTESLLEELQALADQRAIGVSSVARLLLSDAVRRERQADAAGR